MVPVRIISLNAWGGAMYDDLAAWLPAADADVLCLQEVTRTAGLEGWTSFTDAARNLPQRADLMTDVRRLLPTYDGWFTASDTGPVHDGAGLEHRQDFGLGLFVRAELVTTGSRAAHVHGRYVDHPDEWPVDGRPRVAQATRLHDPATRRFVTVAQMHGLRDPAGKEDTPARRAQAELLADLVDSVREPGDVVVVAGDFNVLPESETFDVLGKLGLVDLVREADTRSSRYRKPVRHASYLLVSDPEAVRHFEIVRHPEVSDHRALVVDL
jgi:endonuclease/exonuclease/phosphatase family metal-dependent hydrolase